MIKAPIPSDETVRLSALLNMGILNSGSENRFDALTREAVMRFNVKISTISLIDKDREWFKSRYGTGLTGGPRDTSFCGHALLADSIFVVEDTLKDERFKDNPYVTGTAFVRFYAGIALRDKATAQPVGVFCIKDDRPRVFDITDVADFIELAKRVEVEINKKVLSK